MISFHRYPKIEHKPTAEALRLAQLDLLKDTTGENHLPYHWAAFVTIGGYADF